jgi:DNA-binding MarR family transcriptional regulator
MNTQQDSVQLDSSVQPGSIVQADRTVQPDSDVQPASAAQQDRAAQPDRAAQQDSDKLAAEIADAFSELFEQMVERFEDLAKRFSLPAFCLKALHMLSSPMAMKELGQRFHCDPSFVTAIADMLDTHGLGRRETDTKDRRIKNLLLTPKGLALRERVEREMANFMPWTYALDRSERQTLLRLLRKMVAAEHERRARERDCPVSKRSAAARSGRGKATGPLISTTPPVGAGGYRAGEVRPASTADAPKDS